MCFHGHRNAATTCEEKSTNSSSAGVRGEQSKSVQRAIVRVAETRCLLAPTKNTQRAAPRGLSEEAPRDPLGGPPEEPLQNPLGRLSEEALQDMGFSNLSDMDVSEAMIDYLLS